MNASPILKQQIDQWAKSLFHLEVESSQLINEGVNLCYQVTTPNNKHLLRVHAQALHDLSDTENEVAILDQLPKVRGFPRPSSSQVYQVNSPSNWPIFLTLFEHQASEPLGSITNETSFQIGQALAQLHGDFSELDHKKLKSKSPTRIINELSQQIQFLYQQNQTLKSYGAEVEASFKHQQTLIEPSKPYICHGDFGINNVHLNEEHKISIGDFEFIHQGSRLFDLANFIWSLYFANYSDALELSKDFIRGYESISKLEAAEQMQLKFYIHLREYWHLGFIGRTDAGEERQRRQGSFAAQHESIVLRLKEDFTLKL